MKKIYFILICLIAFTTFAQVPKKMSYQGIAYDSSGAPVVGPTPISVQFSILDSYSATIPLYQEHFSSVVPDAQGVFSLYIGSGTPSSGYDFLSLNWALGDKWLKVDVDLSNGTSYSTPLGTSQLVTVPYAFYAEKAKNIETAAQANYVATVKNIFDLKNFQDFDPEDPQVAKVVYVQGYYQSSDGGGGTFIFKKYDGSPPNINSNPRLPPADHGCFIKSSVPALENKGIWVRQFDGEINVRYYGVLGDGGVDRDGITMNDRVQEAINLAAASVTDTGIRKFGHDRSNIVFFPPGDYQLSYIIIKSGVELKGSSIEHTVINYTGSDSPALFVLDSGVVYGFRISDMSIIGPESHDKIVHGFYLTATQKKGTGGAGLWQSVFKNLRISRFTGNAMYFEGGSANTRYADTEVYNRVNQFNTFENVHVEGRGDLELNLGYHALQIVGQNGQFSFNNCRFDSGRSFGKDPYDVNGIGVYIGSLNPGDVITPNIINFNTCSFQTGDVGIWLESANNINIYGCWFEQVNTAVVVKGTYDVSKSINIMNNLFGVTDKREKQEYPLSVISYENAQINVMNNYITDYDPYDDYFNFIHLESAPGGLPGRNLGANTIGNAFTSKPLNYSWGLKKEINQSTITNEELITENARLVQVKLTDDITIDELSSYIAAGEMISIMADGANITFTENRNLFLANMNNPTGPDNNGSIKINHGGIITFVKVDEIVSRPGETPTQYKETYHIVSYKNRE